MLARTGTSAVHILTAGLTGWALALTWQKRRFLPLLLAYLCSVMIHGLWNGLTLMYSFNLLVTTTEIRPGCRQSSMRLVPARLWR